MSGARRWRSATIMTVTVAATLAVAACTAFGADAPSSPPSDRAPSPTASEPTAPPATATPSSSATPTPAAALERVKSATLFIVAEGTRATPDKPVPTLWSWKGSGFLLSEDGLAVTNNHVAAGATTLEVRVGDHDAAIAPARVVATSDCLDLAVLDLDGGPYPFLNWRDDDVAEGLDVFAAGYPGVGSTPDAYRLTRGIVSTIGFPWSAPFASVPRVLEHDARIRGGSSGGPLVDVDGAVVGVNYAGNDIDDASYAIEGVLASASVDRLVAGELDPWLGVAAETWAPDDDSDVTVWITTVVPDGPADTAGVRAGDQILSLGGVDLGDDPTLATYCETLASHRPDATIPVEVYRPTTGELLSGAINGAALERVGDDPAPSTTPTVGPPDVLDGWVTVSDETGVISSAIPEDWEYDGALRYGTDGIERPSLVAAPSAAGFFQGDAGGGFEVLLLPDFSGTDDELVEETSHLWDVGCEDLEFNGATDSPLVVGTAVDAECGDTRLSIVAGVDPSTDVPLVIAMRFTQDDFDRGPPAAIWESLVITP